MDKKQRSSISDPEFINVLNHMVRDNVILSEKENLTSVSIPKWIKNIAIWWSNDQISNDDFIKSIQYLVKKGII